MVERLTEKTTPRILPAIEISKVPVLSVPPSFHVGQENKTGCVFNVVEKTIMCEVVQRYKVISVENMAIWHPCAKRQWVVPSATTHNPEREALVPAQVEVDQRYLLTLYEKCQEID